MKKLKSKPHSGKQGITGQHCQQTWLQGTPEIFLEELGNGGENDGQVKEDCGVEHAAKHRASSMVHPLEVVREMLKHVGVGRMTEGFNGGPGEAAFTDMLTQEYAREISRSGGFGLADQILIGMKEAGK